METQKNKFYKKPIPPTEDFLAYGKMQPNNLAAEKAILGQLLLGSGKVAEVMEILTDGEKFYNDGHVAIFDVIVSLHNSGKQIDSVTVMTELSVRGQLERIGGGYTLALLTDNIAFDHTILSHALTVLECWKRREAIKVTGEIMGKAYDLSEEIDDAVHSGEKKLISIVAEGDISEAKSLRECMPDFITRLNEAMNNTGDITGVNTGFGYLNTLTGGWQNGDLIILAARPSVGKTAFAINLAMNACMETNSPVPVAVFSMEMPTNSLIQRMASAVSRIDLEKITKGRLSDLEYNAVNATIDRLITEPIYIDDTFSVSIAQLRTRVKKLKRKHNIGLLIIDYLQLMSGEKGKGNREQEISSISRGLKGIAKELNIPVIALSQMSRDIEKQGGKGSKREPMLSDLRESGAIEQDADIVMFIYHDQNEDGELKNVVKIAKNRNGNLGNMDQCKFFGNIQKWMNPSDADIYMGNTPYKPFAGMPSHPDYKIEGSRQLTAYDDTPF